MAPDVIGVDGNGGGLGGGTGDWVGEAISPASPVAVVAEMRLLCLAAWFVENLELLECRGYPRRRRHMTAAAF